MVIVAIIIRIITLAISIITCAIVTGLVPIIMFAVLLRRVILAVVGVGVVVVVGPLRGVIELARFGAGM